MRHAEFLVVQHRVWNALRRGDRLTIAALAERFGYPKPNLGRYLRALVAAGWVASERGAGNGRPSEFWLVEDLGPFPPQFRRRSDLLTDLRVQLGDLPCHPPQLTLPLVNPNQAGQVGDPHQRLWNALRIQRRGKWSDFAAPAEVCRRTAVTYLQSLRRVGYCESVRQRGRDGFLVWRLLRDTGPVAPVLCGEAVYDPNLDEEVK